MSNTPKSASTRSHFARRCSLVIAGVAIVLTAIATDWSQTLRPGQLIDRPGTYRFPSGNKTLQISMDDNSNAVVTILHGTSKETAGTPVYSFESEREWFAAIDQYQRLWLYRGHWNPEWGNNRKMPSGGSVPHYPAVIMEGVSFVAPERTAFGSQVVSFTGHWAGVPQSFLDRIPDREGTQWVNVPENPPVTAPQFTEQEEKLIAMKLSYIH